MALHVPFEMERLRWRRIVLALVLLPIVYVDNPIVRIKALDDASPYSYLPVAAMVALACGLALVGLYTGRLQRNATFLDAPVAALAAVAIVWSLAGFLLNSSSLVLDDLFQVSEFCAFYFAATCCIQDRDDVYLLVKVVMVLTAVSAASDFVVAFGTWNRAIDGFPRIEPTGIRALPALILPVVFATAVYTGAAQRRWLLPVLGVLAVWTIASLTRGLWFANFVAIVFLLAAGAKGADRIRMLKVLGTLVGALLIVAIPVIAVAHFVAPHLLDTLAFRITYTPQQLFFPTNLVQQRREIEVVEIVNNLEGSPANIVLGRGLGATYIGQTGSGPTIITGPRHFIHDSYAALWFRMGVVGLGVYLWLAIRFLRRGLVVVRSALPADRGLALGLIAYFVGLLTYSITSDSILRHPISLFTAAAMAAVIALRPAVSRVRPAPQLDPVEA